jgi:uncharacterized protein (DUF305 family)
LRFTFDGYHGMVPHHQEAVESLASVLTRTENPALQAFMQQGMIGHHQGALDMAKQILAVTERSELKAMAQAIVRTQGAEVAQLRSWLDGASSSNPQLSPVPHDHSDGHAH